MNKQHEVEGKSPPKGDETFIPTPAVPPANCVACGNRLILISKLPALRVV